jgi:PAS domain S-box-containing protein
LEKDRSDQTGLGTSRGRGDEYALRGLQDWRSLFHAVPQPAVILDLQYTITAVNLAALKATGKTENEIIGRKCYELFHGTGGPPSNCPMGKLLSDGWSPPAEIEVESFSRTFLVSCTPIQDKKGKVVRILHLATDVTELKETRRALEESREKYRTHFAHVSDVIFCIDRELRITNVSPSIERTLGYRPEEVIGKTVAELPFLAPESVNPAITNVERTFTGEKVAPAEYTLISKDGSRRFGEVNRYPRKLEDGNIVGIMTVTRDVTERRQAQEVIKEFEGRYKDLADQLPQTIVELNLEGDVTFVNRDGLKAFGYTREDLDKGVNVLQVVAPEDRDRLQRNIPRLLLGEKLGSSEFAMMKKDGTTFPALVYSAPVMSGGKPQGLRSIVIDISERKRVEEALRESEQRYRGLFEHAMIGIFQSTPEGNYICVNPAYARIHGYSTPEEMMAEVEDISSRVYVNPDDRTRYIKLLETEQLVKDFETEVKRRDGSRVQLSVTVRAIRDAGGTVAHYEGMVEDITDRKASEEALRKREAELDVKSIHLEEANTALRVILRQREEHEKDMENTILGNVQKIILPYVEKLKASHLAQTQKGLLNIIESELKNAVSPFLQKLTAVYSRFTPAEIQVADLVKSGKSTKEIAEMLSVGTGTVDTHRKSIRNKLGLSNKKINLQTYLRSLE